MTRQPSPMVRLFSALAAAGCLVTGLATTGLAQGLPGLSIFSGIERVNQLNFRLDNFGRPGATDRYHLRIPATKMDLAVSQFAITYPESYRGTFDDQDIEVKVNNKSIALDKAVWDKDNRVIEIYPVEPVPADTRVEIVLSNVRNPRYVGTHYFNALVRSPGDLPMLRYVGTWQVSISPYHNNSL
ncbi:MAG TPA: DUF2808 domain-containing protein [Trichocoleus sp.]